MTELTPKRILREIGRKYPQAWQQFKMFRAGKGKDLADWPDWCYVPIAAGCAIVSLDAGDNPHLRDLRLSPAVMTAAATWRVSQGVYRFDADLYNALVSQPMDGNLPCDALKRLPEWCVYVETIPGEDAVRSGKLHVTGFWAHLEHDANTGRIELRFVFFWNTDILLPVPVHLGDWTLKEGVRRVIDVAKETSKQHGIKIPDGLEDVADLTPYVQLILYLCAENADMPQVRHPNTRVRMSGQVDVPREAKLWSVGERIGSAIRKCRNEELTEYKGGAHASPRPHVRRAHWHHFWAGPREGERKLILRWLPPIPVGVDNEEGPAVIHKVSGKEVSQ